MANTPPTFLPASTIWGPTGLLTDYKPHSPFMNRDLGTASNQITDSFLDSISNDEHLNSLHVVDYLRSNTHEGYLPPDSWRYYLCEALARHYAYSTITDARTMSVQHRGRCTALRSTFSDYLRDAIEQGDYGRPSHACQDHLINYEQKLLNTTFRHFQDMQGLCIDNNEELMRQIYRLLNMDHRSIIMAEDPEQPGIWNRRSDPAEWLMKQIDKINAGWIDYLAITGMEFVEIGRPGFLRWHAQRQAKREALILCEELVEQIKRWQESGRPVPVAGETID